MTLLQSDGRWPCLKIGNNPGCGSSFANRYGVVRHMESVHQRTLEKKKGYHPADGYLFEYDRVAHQKPTASFDEHLLADLSTTATPVGAGVSFVSLTRGRGRARGRAPASAAPAAIGAPGAAVPVPAAAAQMPAAAAQRCRLLRLRHRRLRQGAGCCEGAGCCSGTARCQGAGQEEEASRRSRRGGQDHPNPNKVATVEEMEVDALPVLVPASKVATGQGRGTRLREMLAAAEAKAGSSGFQVGPNYATRRETGQYDDVSEEEEGAVGGAPRASRADRATTRPIFLRPRCTDVRFRSPSPVWQGCAPRPEDFVDLTDTPPPAAQPAAEHADGHETGHARPVSA